MIYAYKPIAFPGPIKIGSSDRPLSRLETALCWSPFQLEMLFIVDGDLVLERRIHHKLRSARLHGEWFSETEEVIQFVSDTIRMGCIPPMEDLADKNLPASDPSQISKIEAMRLEGLTFQQIGDEFKVSRQAIQQILKKSNIDLERGDVLSARNDRCKYLELNCQDINLLLKEAGVSQISWKRYKSGTGSLSEKSIEKMESALKKIQSERQSDEYHGKARAGAAQD